MLFYIKCWGIIFVIGFEAFGLFGLDRGFGLLLKMMKIDGLFEEDVFLGRYFGFGLIFHFDIEYLWNFMN
jgi:hypothetical protein